MDETAAQKKLNELYISQEDAFAALRRAISYVRALEEKHRISPLLAAQEERLKECWAEVAANHKDIYSLSKLVDQNRRSYFKNNKLPELEVEFINALDRLSIWKYAVEEAKQAAAPRDDTAAVVPVSAAATSHIKLPRLSIPPFSGKVTEWVPFRDSFTALVKSNNSFKDVEKLHYLKACVQGEASEIICNVQLANDNFKTAWTLLEARYENKRVAVNAHLSEIMKLESIKRESASSL